MTHFPLKIASVITGLNRGGAEIALLRLIQQTRSEVRHLVLSLSGSGALADTMREAGALVYEVGGKSLSAPFRLVPAIRAIRHFAPDVVAAHMYHACAAASLLRPLVGPVPLVWYIHHTVPDLAMEGRGTRLGIRLCRATAAAPERVVYLDETSAEQHKSLGFAADNEIIPNGIDPTSFDFSPQDRVAVRTELGFGPDDFVYGHVARVHPLKDHRTMIAALEQAVAENPRIGAVFCGAGTESLDIPSSLRDRVRRLGVRSDVHRIVSASDAGVLSSKSEGLPLVVMEFLACQRPFVSTDVGAVRSIIGNPDLLARPGCPEQLAERLVAVSRWPTERLSRVGSVGAESIRNRFSMSSVASRHMELWRSLI